MPVHVNLSKEGMIYQRQQYGNGGIGRRYWDFRDDLVLRYVKGSAILDVGCGEGITLGKIVTRFPAANVVGVDMEPENIQICKTYGLKVVEGSAYSLPFQDGTVDCVVLSEVIEHLDSPEKCVREISRVLAKGGRLIVVFPNDAMFLLSRLVMFKWKEAFYDAGHVKQWTPSEIQGLLGAAGFNVIAAKNIPFVLWPVSLHHVAIAEKK